jgi:hypothetical protein
VPRGVATITATLALLGAAALTPAPAAAVEEPCPTPPLCVETDANGIYNLYVPPLSVVATLYPQVAPLQDCYWETVEANFGDGSPNETYVWDATKAMTGSHTFPAPGSYTVHIDATQGHHVPSGEPCPDFPITATVTYPEPPPVEPPTEKPPPEKTGGGDTVPPLLPVGPVTTTPNAFDQSGPPGGNVYWRRCRGDVLTHLVTCRKGRRVAGRALERLARRGSARVAGFACRLTPASARPLTCSRGTERILGPAG